MAQYDTSFRPRAKRRKCTLLGSKNLSKHTISVVHIFFSIFLNHPPVTIHNLVTTFFIFFGEKLTLKV